MSELGDWLAVNVMGFQTCRTCTDPHFVDADGEWVSGYSGWDPEHNDQQALQVIDKMVELGWFYELRNVVFEVVHCKFWLADEIWTRVSTTRATRAEAICYAAKAAIEAERAAARPKAHRCKGMAEYQRWERVENSWWFITEEEKFRQALVIGASYCHLCGEKLGD